MIDQIGIALTGAVAVALTQSKHESRRRYACLFGLAGQPFWFYSAFTAEQWGIFALCLLYAGAWAKGFWQHWIAPSIDIAVAEGLAIDLGLRREGDV